MSDQILSSSAAAKYIGTSKKTLLTYAKQRRIVFMRYPSGALKFRKESLDNFLLRCTVTPPMKKAAA
jgi:hypothetical protein